MNYKAKSNKGNPVVAAIVIVLVVVGVIFFGVNTKIKMGNSVDLEQLFEEGIVEGKGVNEPIKTQAIKFLELSKRINGIIPAGKDYYYLIFNEDYTKCIAYRGSKAWNKSFDDVTGLSSKDVEIKGIVKEMSYDVSSQYNVFINGLKAEGYYISPQYYYIDGGAEVYSTIQIATGIVAILLAIFMVVILKFNVSNKLFKRLAFLLLILLFIFTLYLYIFQ